MIPEPVAAAAALGALTLAVLTGRVHQRTPARSSRPGGRRTPVPARLARGHPRARPREPHGGPPSTGARWARSRDLLPLRVTRGEAGRLVLGQGAGRSSRKLLLAAEAAQSVAVIGPTQSGKTTGVAVPAILGWDGPVLAASVKTDLVRDTLAWRHSVGQVWCFDPAGTTGLPQSRWSPVPGAATWSTARRAAADLTALTRSEATTADGEFWYATAAKLLAPLLFAAASAGLTMHDIVRWVDTQETEEVVDILHGTGVPEAIQAARATWLRDERHRSAVYTTAETVLEPFAEPELVIEATQGSASTPGAMIEAEELLSGTGTLYVCAPAHDQRRLRAVFVALVQQVLHAAFARSSRLGRPIEPPLLVVLDEAANIAPLADLDGLAATCAGHGVQLVTVWQDLAQVRARFGERAATVVNNHRAKLFLPGIADPGTLEFASQLAGDQDVDVPAWTVGPRGERTITTSPQVRKLLPPDALRRLSPGEAVLLYGSLPPARLVLRPWFATPELEDRVETCRAAEPGAAPGAPITARPAGVPGRGRKIVRRALQSR